MKEKVNASLAEAQEALTGTDTEIIRKAMEKLATDSQALGQALYADQAAAGGAAPGDAPGAQAGPDDVVDAEIVDEPVDMGKDDQK